MFVPGIPVITGNKEFHNRHRNLKISQTSEVQSPMNSLQPKIVGTVTSPKSPVSRHPSHVKQTTTVNDSAKEPKPIKREAV